MSSIKRKALVLLLLLLALPALASEEGGEGGKNDKKAEDTPAREFVSKTTKMNALQVKMLDSEREFAKLVEEKDIEKDQKKLQDILKEMIDVSDRRNKDAEEYNRLRQELLYQYPAKAAELNRLYETQDKKSIDDLQSAADLDELLTQVKIAIERKFAPLMPENEKKAVAAPPPPEEEPKRLKLEK